MTQVAAGDPRLRPSSNPAHHPGRPSRQAGRRAPSGPDRVERQRRTHLRHRQHRLRDHPHHARLRQWGGVGTAPVERVIEIARAQDCSRLWQVTTNDNVDSIRFYQRRGFGPSTVRCDAVDYARRHGDRARQFDNAQPEVQALAEALDVPVYGNSRARGVLPHDHELNGGNIAGLAACGQTPDVVVVLGARTSQMTIGRRGAGVLGPDTTLVQVDANPEEPGRNVPVDISYIGSIAQFARTVRDAATGLQVRERTAWRAATRATYFSLDRYEDEARNHDGDGIHPYWFGRHIVDALAEDAIVVGDGSEAYHWVEPIARTAGLGRWMGHGYFGCLGIGSPFAIGAQIAHPDTQVVQVVGDGSVGFNIQEFDTMVRHRLPIITVVNSNRAWGISAHSQDALAGRRVISDLPLTAFHEVMVAFGGHGELVTEVDQIGPAFKRALASGLPACINIVTDPTVVSPRVRATNRVMADNVGLRPEDRLAPEGTPIAVPYYEPLAR
ncbi:MAG TPA: GNAT family N-acetyltransferase [Aldersonia sp.]